MHTIQLKINDSIYDKFLQLIGKFKKDEIEIISDETEFATTKEYLQKEYYDIVAEKAVFYSIDEVDAELDELIAKYENQH
jgi:hypothetical protein